jgi:uncharacterized phage protein (TIGR01671 family)
MREIKFRGWDDIVNDFCYLIINHGSFPHIIESKGLKPNVKKWEQYTGLKDKNGKEIYEGDIVLYGINEHKYEVKWVVDEEIDAFKYTGWDITSWYDKETSEEYTVIGNIYENPELLNNI